MQKKSPNTDISAPAQGSLLAVQVMPKSSKNQIEGQVTDAAGKNWQKVRLTAPPEDGKANAALIKLLAKEWNIAANKIHIQSGHTGRKKILTII